MDLNVVILSLQYSYLISSLVGLYETNTGLWRSHDKCSQTLLPYSVLSKHRSNVRILDNMAALRETTLNLNHNGTGQENHIKLIEPQLSNQLITVSINGNETFINNSRTEILRVYDQVSFRRITLTSAQFEQIGQGFLDKLNQIASRRQVEITIDNTDSDFNGQPTPSALTSIYILGTMDALAVAETEVQVLVNVSLDKCYVERITVPLSLIPSLGGANLANFTEIANHLNVSIYLPFLMPHVFHSRVTDTNASASIYLTSPRVPEILLTKNTIASLIQAVDPRANNLCKLYVQEIDFAKEKLDLISLYRQSEVLAIMLKHGVYVQVPQLGDARDSRVVVTGQREHAVKEAVTEVSGLSTEFYTLDIRFLKGPTLGDFEYYLINLINLKRTCVLTCNQNGMSVVGDKDEIKKLLDEFVSDLQTSTLFTNLVNESDTKFQMVLSMELNNQHRGFLSGKKNGKIIKILNQLGNVPTIKFKPLNNYNFLIDTSIRVGLGIKNKQMLSVFELLVKCVSLVELELPAEMRFNIPEVFHKSIIGNGGSIIQSIMKKYNVFIQFTSLAHSRKKTDVKKDTMLYVFQRTNNVLVKCPMKNLKNILYVKYELENLVAQCCQNRCPPLNGIATRYNNVDFTLLKSHYLMLSKMEKFNLTFVSDLETEFNTYIDFPSSVQDFTGSSLDLHIKGSDSRARQCAQRLSEMLPLSYEFHITFCPGKFDELINENNIEFREKILIPFSLLLGAELVTTLVLILDQTTPFHQIIVSSYEDAQLRKAVAELTSYLREKSFLILEKQDLKFEPFKPQEILESPTKSPEKHKNSKSPNKSPTKLPHKKALKTITNRTNSGGKRPTMAPFSLPIPNC